ncbi:MAG: glyceraldehyde 3-phosphate dehydrogenase [Patescibacteria group bacterium]|jgi:glyceraldehyde 3-phosphate dehydrogenase
MPLEGITNRKMRVAINGFGRIGRVITRILLEQGHKIIAINDTHDIESTKYLLQYDSVYGPLKDEIKINKNKLLVKNQEIRISNQRDPLKLPWKKLNIDIVIEATGAFTDPKKAKAHIKAGAKHVIITAPCKNNKPDNVVIPGVTTQKIKKTDEVLSIASCTTNCLAPLIAILNENFTVEKALFTTIHAYTNNQELQDTHHNKFSRGRAAAINIIPTTTGASAAIESLFPKLKGKIKGHALRVPIPNGSLIDLIVTLKKKPTIIQLQRALKTASQEQYKNILEYTTDPIVSNDIIGNSHSSVIAGDLIQKVGNSYRINAWYDNEYGYSSRVVDTIEQIEHLYQK